MNFFGKIIFFIAVVLPSIGNCFNYDVDYERQVKKELSAIMLYAQALKKNGLSHDLIVQECTDLLLKDLALQDKPAVSDKTLLLIGLAAAGVVVMGVFVYYFFDTQNKADDEEDDVVHYPLVQGVNYNIVGGNIVHQHFNQDNTAAIVNAANEALQGGGGVDGGIHLAAGAEQLRQYCRDNFAVNARGNRLNPGQAVITPGFNLAPRRIIHTIAPRANVDRRWRNTLANSYRSCMRVADENNLTAVAFPALGTGIFGCDPGISAGIAVRTVNRYLAEHPQSEINEVRFVCWGNNIQRYQHEIAQISV